MDVKLRDTLVTPSVNTYAYKSYLENLLCFGEAAKDNQKTLEGWYADRSNALDDSDAATTRNDGVKKRAALVAGSSSLELMGRPHVDILHQDKYLIPGVDLSFKFTRSPSAFHLMSDANDYKVVIEEAALYIRRVKLNPSIAMEHADEINKGTNAKYPLRRGIATTFTVGSGARSFNRENVITGQLPRRLIVGLVENSAFNGARNKNPFNFAHFNLNYLSVSIGSQNFPSQPLKPNFNNGAYMQAYNCLMTGLGLSNANKGIGIDRDQYKKGCVLYAFDFTPDMAEGAHVDPVNYGNVRMEASFSGALVNAVNVVLYAEYDNVMQIDRARSVKPDFP